MAPETTSPRAELEERLRFETLLADLSSHFINLPPGDVDREIIEAQRRMCDILSLDLAGLWQRSNEVGGSFVLTHLYRLEQGPQPPEPMTTREYFPWYEQQMLAGRTIAIRSMEELPAEAARDRETYGHFGIKSVVAVPLTVGGGPPIGILGFNTTRAERDWPAALVKRLQLVAQTFTNALARKRADEALRESKALLEAGADLAGLGCYEVDFAERRCYIDDRFHEICGVPAGRHPSLLPVQLWTEHLHPEDSPRVLEARDKLHDGRIERISIEYRYLHPTQGQKWIHHVARVAARDATAHTVRSYGAIRDITPQKQAEEALLKSYAEIERLKDKLQAESDYLKAEVKVTQAHGEVIGKSPAIRKVLSQAEQVAPTDSSVLISGETGTGKELIAQTIHRLSSRGSHLMVKVNCAALPTALVESELFGREKGAFTGALMRQIGRFEVADGSTIFLDELGELSLEVQAKLLRVLQEGQFERLGSPRTIKVNVRVIGATNRDLREEVRKGRFREDLYYRLNVFPIRVPPLRERIEDIPLLVWAFLEELSSRMGKRITRVPRKTMDMLQRHPWPGNIRELRNVIEHSTIITTGDTLRVPLFEQASPEALPVETLADSEREHITKALQKTAWRIKGPKGAAALLGLKPSTLYKRMLKLDIPTRRQKDEAAG